MKTRRKQTKRKERGQLGRGRSEEHKKVGGIILIEEEGRDRRGARAGGGLGKGQGKRGWKSR
jgi:hypothetical protein